MGILDQPDSEKIIAAKKEILRKVPYSIDEVNGREKVFFIVEPGIDAHLADDGTVVIRNGWGARAEIRRYNGFFVGLEKLKAMGFYPYGIFKGNSYEIYLKKHADARERKFKQQQIVPNVMTVQQTQPQMPQQKQAAPMNIELKMPAMQVPRFIDSSTEKQLSQYEKDLSNFNDIMKTTQNPLSGQIGLGKSLDQDILSADQFSAQMQKSYGVLMGLQRQVGILKPLRKKNKDKDKDKDKDKGREEYE